MLRISVFSCAGSFRIPLVALLLVATGCATYGERVAPVKLPEASPQSVTVGGAAGAIGGGASRYRNLDRGIREDLEQKSLRIQRIPEGDLAYGYLFFPGRDEAQSAQRLRLALEVGGESRVVELPL